MTMVPGAFLAVILDHLLFVFRIERTLRGIDRFFLPAHRLLRIHRRQQRAPPAISVIGLRLIGRLLLIAAALRRIAEQEFDEAAAHVGAFGRSHAHRRRLRGLTGVDHGGFGNWRGVDRKGLTGEAKARRARKERKGDFSGHRRTLYCSSLRVGGAARRAPLHAINTNQNLIGLVNRIGRFDSPRRQSRADLSGSVYFA